MAGEEFLDTRQDVGYACAGGKGRVTNSHRGAARDGPKRAGGGSKYLMEINLVEISSSEHQAYWLLFVKAAGVMPF